MRFSTTFSAVVAASALSAAANPVNHDNVYNLGGLQEQMPIGDVAPSTRTRVVTETQTFYEVVETVYMTKPLLVPTWVAVASTPEQEEARREDDVCDEQKEIGCAICRTIHQCGDFEEGCTACDASPACLACQPELPSKQPLPPVISLGISCSLGPGRTVPCELVNKDGVKEPVYSFGEGSNE